MSKSAQDINNELTLYQCCIADKAIEYINKEINGIEDLDCLLSKLEYLTLRVETLKRWQSIISLEQMTQDQIEAELEKLNDLCGCINCNIQQTLSDTLPQGLSILNINSKRRVPLIVN